MSSDVLAAIRFPQVPFSNWTSITTSLLMQHVYDLFPSGQINPSLVSTLMVLPGPAQLSSSLSTSIVALRFTSQDNDQVNSILQSLPVLNTPELGDPSFLTVSVLPALPCASGNPPPTQYPDANGTYDHNGVLPWSISSRFSAVKEVSALGIMMSAGLPTQLGVSRGGVIQGLVCYCLAYYFILYLGLFVAMTVSPRHSSFRWTMLAVCELCALACSVGGIIVPLMYARRQPFLEQVLLAIITAVATILGVTHFFCCASSATNAVFSTKESDLDSNSNPQHKKKKSNCCCCWRSKAKNSGVRHDDRLSGVVNGDGHGNGDGGERGDKIEEEGGGGGGMDNNFRPSRGFYCFHTTHMCAVYLAMVGGVLHILQWSEWGLYLNSPLYPTIFCAALALFGGGILTLSGVSLLLLIATGKGPLAPAGPTLGGFLRGVEYSDSPQMSSNALLPRPAPVVPVENREHEENPNHPSLDNPVDYNPHSPKRMMMINGSGAPTAAAVVPIITGGVPVAVAIDRDDDDDDDADDDDDDDSDEKNQDQRRSEKEEHNDENNNNSNNNNDDDGGNKDKHNPRDQDQNGEDDEDDEEGDEAIEFPPDLEPSELPGGLPLRTHLHTGLQSMGMGLGMGGLGKPVRVDRLEAEANAVAVEDEGVEVQVVEEPEEAHQGSKVAENHSGDKQAIELMKM